MGTVYYYRGGGFLQIRIWDSRVFLLLGVLALIFFLGNKKLEYLPI